MEAVIKRQRIIGNDDGNSEDSEEESSILIEIPKKLIDSDSKLAKLALKKQVKTSSVIVNFSDQDGNRTGSQIDLALNTNLKQLEILINTLIRPLKDLDDASSGSSAIPYAFYINGIEVTTSIEDALTQSITEGQKISYEDTLVISYQPLSVFKVRPVTRCTETMPGHTDAVLHVSYSPDGKRLASGGGDMAVRFWNPHTATPSHTCLGHRNHVLCTTWSPDGNIFLSADKSGEIRAWDPKTGLSHGKALTGHKKWVTSLAFEPLHLNPTCNRFVSSSKDTTVKVWNISTGLCEATISGHSDSIECVKWGGTGLLYTCSRDRTIKVYAVDGHGRSLHMLVRTLTGHAHRINTLALNCDYVLRTGAYEFGQPYPDTLEEIQAKALQRYQAVVGSESNGEILVSGSDDFTMFMWKPQESKHCVAPRMTGHQQLINHIAFSPDARYFASASFDKKIKVWCGKTGRFLATLHGHVGSVYQVTWSMNSQYLVSASKDSTLKLWNVKAPKTAVHTLPGHEDEVYSLDWSPDGSQVASGSKDRTIKIWHH